MNTAEYVNEQIQILKTSGIPLSEAAWKAALLCVGWAYVFGARGQYCTPANRRSRYNGTNPGKNKDNIKSKCKNFDGSGSCSGCKWYPAGSRTRFFDCRGFTYWILLQVYGWKLMGAGATSQWNTASNWRAKGRIADGMPKDTLVCLFYSKDNKEVTWEHTGFGYNNETVECSNGVQYSKTRNKKWTHWAIPACVREGGDEPMPETKPTLRRGSKGSYVTLAQSELFNKGYDLGKSGIDGDFGKATEAAVKAFQKDVGLTADGIIGPKTWEALDRQTPVTVLYMVSVPHLTKAQAEALVAQYPGSSMTEERG